MRLPSPRSTLFPYTTLFRSLGPGRGGSQPARARREQGERQRRRGCPRSCDWLQWLARVDDAALRLEESRPEARDRKSTRLNSSHLGISYAVFCLKKKIKKI